MREVSDTVGLKATSKLEGKIQMPLSTDLVADHAKLKMKSQYKNYFYSLMSILNDLLFA